MYYQYVTGMYEAAVVHTYIHTLYFSSNLRVAIINANFSEKTITKITKYTTTY